MPIRHTHRQLLLAEASARRLINAAVRDTEFGTRRRGLGPRSRIAEGANARLEEAVRETRRGARSRAARLVARRLGVPVPSLPGTSSRDRSRAARAARGLSNRYDKTFTRRLRLGDTVRAARREAERAVRRHAAMTAATESSHAFNEATRLTVRRAVEDNPTLRRLFALEWRGTGVDMCPACSELHETRVPLDRDFSEVCPLHPNCRCDIEIVDL